MSKGNSRVRAAYRTGRSGKVKDNHLGRHRLDSRPSAYRDGHEPQPPDWLPASKKGVVLYALVNYSKDYREVTNSFRERLRRVQQIKRGQLKAENGLVRHG